MKIYKEIIFDVETKSFFSDGNYDPSKLGVSIVSAYFREIDEQFNELNGEMKSFWESDFPSFFNSLTFVDRIIGFNTISFDIPTLKPYTSIPIEKLPHFDILAYIKTQTGKRFSLDALSKETLGSQKNDIGTNAILYWQKGDEESLKKLQKYCEMDVALTRDLYDFGLKNKYLKVKDKWNTVRQFEVDFSYPIINNSTNQESLF